MHYHVEHNYGHYGHYAQKYRVETLAEAKNYVRAEVERHIKCLREALKYVGEDRWQRVAQGRWQVTFYPCTNKKCPSCDDPKVEMEEVK